MKAILSALAALILLTGSAFAANTEGTIKKLDKSALTLTLDDGKTFKLSEEFSFEEYSEGMAVMIQYDEIKGENIVLQIIPN